MTFWKRLLLLPGVNPLRTSIVRDCFIGFLVKVETSKSNDLHVISCDKSPCMHLFTASFRRDQSPIKGKFLYTCDKEHVAFSYSQNLVEKPRQIFVNKHVFANMDTFL